MPFPLRLCTLTLAGNRIPVKTVIGGDTYWRRYYDQNGWTDSLTASGASFVKREYTYNRSRGTLESIKLGSRTTSFSFDDNFRPTQTTFSGGDVVGREYLSINSVGSIGTTAPYSAAVRNEIEYDNMSRIEHQVNEFMGNLVRSSYTYDDLGRLVADTVEQAAAGTCTWYDDRGSVCTPQGSWQSNSTLTFSYDSVGNRRDGGRTYSDGNRLSASTGCTYQHDADGNMTVSDCSAAEVNYEWSADNRLIEQQAVGGDSVELAYDGFGRLVRIKVNGSVTSYFLWDGSNVFAELNSSGSKVAEYSYYGTDDLHALVIGTEPYAHVNGSGSVTALTDRYKAVKRTRIQLNPWYEGTAGTSSMPCTDCDRPRFKGALKVGEVGLTYMRNRWYSSSQGRFISEDPIGLAGGINQYAYAGNDPVNRGDHLGLSPTCSWHISLRGGVLHLDYFCELEPIGVTAPRLGSRFSATYERMDARASSFGWYSNFGGASSAAQGRQMRSSGGYVDSNVPENACEMEELAVVGALAYEFALGASYLSGSGLIARGAVTFMGGVYGARTAAWAAQSAAAYPMWRYISAGFEVEAAANRAAGIAMMSMGTARTTYSVYATVADGVSMFPSLTYRHFKSRLNACRGN